MEHVRTPLAASLWGDGWHDDGFAAVAVVQLWDACASDEYLRVFPRLLPNDGRLPKPLERHMVACVAVRALRLSRRRGDTRLPPLASMRPEVADGLGRERHDDWFRSPGKATGLLAWLWNDRDQSRQVTSEWDALHRVDALLAEVQAGSLRRFETGAAMLFAFDTGIHPAYLWADALVAHEMFTAAAWLGHLSRGRRALVPNDIAAYFDDVMERRGAITVKDPHLARLLDRQDWLAEVWRVKEQRKRGGDPVAAWPIAAARPSVVRGPRNAARPEIDRSRPRSVVEGASRC